MGANRLAAKGDLRNQIGTFELEKGLLPRERDRLKLDGQTVVFEVIEKLGQLRFQLRQNGVKGLVESVGSGIGMPQRPLVSTGGAPLPHLPHEGPDG